MLVIWYDDATNALLGYRLYTPNLAGDHVCLTTIGCYLNGDGTVTLRKP